MIKVYFNNKTYKDLINFNIIQIICVLVSYKT